MGGPDVGGSALGRDERQACAGTGENGVETGRLVAAASRGARRRRDRPCRERGGRTQKAPCVGKGTELGLGPLGWGTVRQQRSHGDACGLVEDHQAQVGLQ